jgi:hypothetical protein
MKRPHLKDLAAIVFAGTLAASVLPAWAQPAKPGMMGNAGPVEVDTALVAASRVNRIAPVSREMILNYVAQNTLGLPKSY